MSASLCSYGGSSDARESDLRELKEKGYIKRVDLTNAQRKAYHMWAEENKLTHVSYTDSNYETETMVQYHCSSCAKWITSTKCVFQPCCIDENGNQACGGTSFWVCPTCDAGSDDDFCPVIVWSSSGRSDLKARSFKAKNAVLISIDGDVGSTKNRALFKECNLSMRAVRRQIARRTSVSLHDPLKPTI